DEHDVSVRFIATATGGTSGMRAQTTFTDASPAADGEGQMTVSPSVVVQGADTTLTFNFMAGQGSFSNNSTVKIAVPSAWPAPQNTPSGSAPWTYGGGGTVTASVTSVTGPTGSVSFYGGGSCSSPGATLASAVTLSGGTASTSPISTLSLGSHSIVACYSGDATYLSSSGSVTQTVNAIQAPDGFGTMTVSPTSVIAGQTGRTLTFTFAVPSNYAFSANSKVNVVVPSVWTTPQIATPSGAAYMRVSSATCSSVDTGTGKIAIFGISITITH